jgi:hypothetical protein
MKTDCHLLLGRGGGAGRLEIFGSSGKGHKDTAAKRKMNAQFSSLESGQNGKGFERNFLC